MGSREQKTYKNYSNNLTDNDKKGLRMLIEKEKEEGGENLETLLYMQEKDVKLEQEAVSILCYNTRRE